MKVGVPRLFFQEEKLMKQIANHLVTVYDPFRKMFAEKILSDTKKRYNE